MDTQRDISQFYISHNAWSGTDFTGDTELSAVIIPTPKGSSAKPHIRVLKSGKLIAEVDARQGCYKQLLEIAERGVTYCHISSKIHEDGRHSHRFEYQLK